MRIRSIRPEFWTSEDVAKLDWDARLVFIGLWSYVDDNGVGRDVEPLIVAALFPLDGALSEPSVRVHGALNQLSEHSLIVRYTVDGKGYLAIPTFSAYQKPNRPTPPRYPLPTCDNVILTESSVSPHGALSPVVVVGVVEGEVTTTPLPPSEGGPEPRLSVVTQPAEKPSRRKTPGHQLPEGFSITDGMKKWSDEQQLVHADVIRQTERFKSWNISKGSLYVDWEHAWRNWINKAVDQGEIRKRGGEETRRPQYEWEMPRRPRSQQ